MAPSSPLRSSLGTVQVGDLSLIDVHGKHLSGPKPSKETFLHAAVLRARLQAQAVIHIHPTFHRLPRFAVRWSRSAEIRKNTPPRVAYPARLPSEALGPWDCTMKLAPARTEIPPLRIMGHCPPRARRLI